LFNQSRVRDAQPNDISTLQAIIHGVGLFTPEEAEGFASTIPDHFAQPSEGHVWLVAGDGQGAGYLAPEAAGPGVWNLLFLGVRPEARRQGVARALITEVERRLQAQGARMLLIDTSTEPPMAAARALYERLGYARVGLIPDYWGPGDGKLTFRRLL
jgi:ribosomal protein S18 acetylase RimI-like enzyme